MFFFVKIICILTGKKIPNFFQNVAFFSNPLAPAQVPKMGVRGLL